MINKTLYSAYYNDVDPFKIFADTKCVHEPDQLTEDGVLILWGGEDISPSLYNQPVVGAHAKASPSRRDVIEKALFERAVELGMPIIGVCRGAQLACALSGGTLFQHIHGGHHGEHKVETKDGRIFETSSCHHQALNLEKVGHELLAWDFNRITTADTDTKTVRIVIPEVAWIPATKTFAIQGHPEWLHHLHPFVQWCAKMFQERIK